MSEEVKKASAEKHEANDKGSEGISMRETFSHEAMSEAIKQSAAAGGAMKELSSIGEKGTNSLPHVEIGKATQLGSMDKNNLNELKDKNSLNKADDLSKELKEGKMDLSEFNGKLSDLFKPKDGVEKLPTGDYLVKEDGKQTLFTPNGDRITINPDGSNTIKGDVEKVSTDKDGVTTVKLGDGSSVSFDKDGFRDVTRGNQSVSFGRPWDGPFNHKEFPHPTDPFPNPIPTFPGHGGWGGTGGGWEGGTGGGGWKGGKGGGLGTGEGTTGTCPPIELPNFRMLNDK